MDLWGFEKSQIVDDGVWYKSSAESHVPKIQGRRFDSEINRFLHHRDLYNSWKEENTPFDHDLYIEPYGLVTGEEGDVKGYTMELGPESADEVSLLDFANGKEDPKDYDIDLEEAMT